MKKATLLSLALLLMAGLLIGCNSSNVKIGWRGSSGPGHMGYHYTMKYSYTTFYGVERKTFRAEAGQSITFEYDVAVEKGALVLNVVDPDGKVLWEETFIEDTIDTATVIAPRNGFHTIGIEGQETGGGFDIAWRIEE
ncbi:MAG: hypothetical protein U9R58_04140 [Chloroflexota bacterium]|nr:hypothetical protein [Chloroflexota bacterium]